MKSYARHASARWVGTRQRGKGAINTPSAALKMALYATDGESKRTGTNPAELMAAAIAGLVGAGAEIRGFEAVDTSYPGFLDELEQLR